MRTIHQVWCLYCLFHSIALTLKKKNNSKEGKYSNSFTFPCFQRRENSIWYDYHKISIYLISTLSRILGRIRFEPVLARYILFLPFCKFLFQNSPKSLWIFCKNQLVFCMHNCFFVVSVRLNYFMTFSLQSKSFWDRNRLAHFITAIRIVV